MCLRPQFVVWRSQWDVLNAGSKAPGTEAAHLLMGRLSLGGMGEEGDQTREVDWGYMKWRNKRMYNIII